MAVRFEAKPQTMVIGAAEYRAGFDVHCEGRYMHVGYVKIATYNDGRVLVLRPEWRETLQ